MDFNNNCKLFLSDIYVYDIRACHYRLLEKYNFDISILDKNNKMKRNIQIGKMMQTNPRLTSFLRKTTETIINNFIQENKIKDDEIILRQYDGIIITRPLRLISTNSIEPELRSIFQTMIISINKKSYIAFDNTKNETIIKGVSNNYSVIDSIYAKIVRINFVYKSSIFNSLQMIKDHFMSFTNPFFFCIPITGKDKYIIFLKDYGEIEISKQTSKIMDIEDIDKKRYFDFYIRPFTETIVNEFVRN